MIKKVTVKNYKSIKNSGDVFFSEKMYVLAGQNESGKSSILEALNAYESEEFDKDSLNFEEVQANDNQKQEVSCTYLVENAKDFTSLLIDEIREKFSVAEDDDFIDTVKLKGITEYTITKTYNHADDTIEVALNDVVHGIVVGAIKNKESVEATSDGKELKKKIPWIDLSDKNEDLGEVFFSVSPAIVLFNDFSDLLPDKIKITDLENKNTKAKGYNAVRNLEKLLNKDFVAIAKLPNNHQTATTAENVTNLSTKFQQAWKQRIYSEGNLYIKFQINNELEGGQIAQTIFFYLETKNNVLLEPRKRSKGMIWFLSAWLELKAMEDGSQKVILYDEPGLHLHVRAHKDILNVFAELIKKSHQIVYSTHSPSLIDTSTLHNIGLVINTKDKGTTVEGLTTSKVNTTYKQDALQPIAEAMGLEPLKDFTVLAKKNVLVEGLSDFWYMQSMSQILGKELDYKFVPGIGIKGNHIYHLISFCIGYGLDWLLVMDNGENPKATKAEISKLVFNDEEELANKSIKLVEAEEIEDLFTLSDIRLVDEKIKETETRSPSQIIGAKRKIVFARDFASKVHNGVITRDLLSPETVEKFEAIFRWIEEAFNNQAT